ncbi:hypothetical protein ABC195_09425 [Microbacterium sp. 2P01SA-2]|uniref:phage major capsid protein n=1 Tax=unclassified Microbacterium TaxID=2609290 RepID=UPI0039A2C45F
MTNGEFSYDPETRTLRGILLPFGELSRTSMSATEPVMFSAASVDLPRDPAVVTLNRRHNRFDPVGRATLLEKRTEGVYAEFRIADTDEGDAYLRDERNTLRKLSAEVTGLIRRGAEAVRSRLTGGALVDEGAFASAALFAIETSEHHEDRYTDAEGVTWQRVEDTERTTADDGTTTTTSTVVESTTTEPAPTDNTDTEADEAEDTDREETALMGTNIVPDGTAATAPRPTLDGLFSAIARNDPSALQPYRQAGELFALQTVQQNNGTTVTVGADTQETGYLGELWTRAAYARRFVPLLGHAPLTNWEMKGWKWVDGKRPEMADYAGNTAEVPSNALDTEPVTVTAARLAGGHRLDRRFTDFNDQAVVASYLVNQAEDYKRKTDAKALAAIIAAGAKGTVTAPGAVPTGVPKGLAAIVDAALAIIQTENRPAYAVVSPELWRDIVLMADDDKLAFLNAGFGLEEGDFAGFKIVPGAVGTGKVTVGAREALTFYELGETPIRVEGVVPGNGATDVAVFGYWAVLEANANAVRTVTVASV